MCVSTGRSRGRRIISKSLTFAYSKAPYFKDYLPLLESFYERHDEFLADFTIETSIILARELGFASTRFLRSSEMADIQGQKTDRFIQILKRVGAKHYICGPIGKQIYGTGEV